jgi:hypothetical protein
MPRLPKAAILDSVRAYTAERSADRPDARANRTGNCYHCLKPMPVERSTRKFCSNRCRQAAYRAR